MSPVFASATRREPVRGGSTPASMLATVRRSEYRTHVLNIGGITASMKNFEYRNC